jgi:hypothetical protein
MKKQFDPDNLIVESKPDFVFSSVAKNDVGRDSGVKKVSIRWNQFHSFSLKYSSILGWSVYGVVPSSGWCGKPIEKLVGYISDEDLISFIGWCEKEDGRSLIAVVSSEYDLSTDFLRIFHRLYNAYVLKRGGNCVQERILF